VRLWSRKMTGYTRHFEPIAQALSDLPEDVLLNGKAVAFHPDALRTSRRCAAAAETRELMELCKVGLGLTKY
jgi:hypothetical protein